MHIVYLINQYPTVSHTFVRRELQALERLGFTVSRISIRDTKASIVDPLDKAESQQTHVLLNVPKCVAAMLWAALSRPLRFLAAAACAIRLWRNAGYGLPRPVAYLAEACRLVHIVRMLGIEHIHAHFATNSAAVALLSKLLGGPPFSFTVHGLEEVERAVAESLAEKVAEAKFVIVISSFGQSQLQRWCDRKHWSKIAIVRCGLDSSYLAQQPVLVPDDNRLVCVARLSEQKGLFTLIEAAIQLAAETKSFELVLVGDGPLRAELQHVLQHSPARDCVRFVGAQTQEQIQEWLVSSRCFVLPSYVEGLPVAIMEALALARPVISTWVAGIPELVVPGENGWLVPAGAVEELVAAMREALATPTDQMYQMGLRGRERVMRLHNIDQSAKQLAALFAGEPGSEVRY